MKNKSIKPCLAFTKAVQLTPWGSIAPCCWYEGQIPYKSGFEFSSLDKIFQDDINTMKKGQWPANCNRCKIAESKNTTSRKEYIEQRATYLTSQSIQVYDINLSNLCNFKCKMCGPEISTSWFDEEPGIAYSASNETINNLINTIANSCNSGTVYMELKGGEPLIMPNVKF